MAAPSIKTVDSQDLNLNSVFSDFYVVPSYQREFVWSVEVVEQLLRDIYDEYSSDSSESEYFIGSMVVCPAKDDLLELIDGQKRITTCYLFLCAMRDHLAAIHAAILPMLETGISADTIDANGDTQHRYRITLQYEDSVHVLGRIASGSEDVASIQPSTRSVENIVNAYSTIRQFLRTEFGEDDKLARKFYAYFINRVKLVRIKTQSVAHALKVFETINDRGVGLDAMDLLKNLMFMQASPKDFETLKKRWKELVDTLYQAKEKPLRFLRYYINSTYGAERLREDEIYRWFVQHEDLCGFGKNPLGFVESLRKAASGFAHFVRGENVDGTPNMYLQNLRELSGSARQHNILLLAGMHLPKPEFTELCRQIENLFFAYIVTRESTQNFERNFTQWSKDLHSVTDTVSLDAFVTSKFGPAKQDLALRFRQAMESLDEYSILKYRLRYILAKLTQYINDRAYGVEVPLRQYLTHVDVEHILPQTPSVAVLAAFDRPDEYDRCLRRLGNLTLLEQPIDASISNGVFEAKRKPYHKSKFLLTRTIMEPIHVGVNTAIDRAVTDLITFERWTSESIELRQFMLAGLAQRVWEMPATPVNPYPERMAAAGAVPALTDAPIIAMVDDDGRDDATSGVQLSSLKQMQLDYWTGFRSFMQERGSSLVSRNPQPRNYATFAMGTTNFEIATAIMVDEKRISVYLGIYGPQAKQRYAELLACKGQIEAEIGAELNWLEDPNWQAAYVSVRKYQIDAWDKSDWPYQYEWLLEYLERFHACFAHRARMLAVGKSPCPDSTGELANK